MVARESGAAAGGVTVGQIGEFGLIDRLCLALGRSGPSAVIGIGDDAAAWNQPAAVLVASADMLVEHVHFDLRLTGWRDLGWKALAVNLSDLAAMGAAPAWALVSIGLRPEIAVDDVLAFYEGMAALAAEAGGAIAGGDTVSVPRDVVIDVSVLGTVPAGEAETLLRRDRGAPGDRLAVTGVLGASAAGLYALQHPGTAPERLVAPLVEAHRRPQPQLRAGQALRAAGVRCAMDVSDGLLADLEKLCIASGTGAVVRAPDLPLHPAARGAFPAHALDWATGGGEDYQLLFAAPAVTMRNALERLARQGIPAREIGQLLPPGQPARLRLVDERGDDVPVALRGWDHFGNPSHDGQ